MCCHSCWPPIILTMHMRAQSTATFLASSHGSCKCGTHFTNIDPAGVTLQAVSGAMFPSGVHCQYLQNTQFGNQPIFYFLHFIFFLTFSKSLTCMFQINLKGLLRPPPVSGCVGTAFAASVLVKLQFVQLTQSAWMFQAARSAQTNAPSFTLRWDNVSFDMLRCKGQASGR